VQHTKSSIVLRSAIVATLVALYAIPTASGASAAGRTPGWTVEGSMLCYTWPTHRWACTSHWHRGSGGALISERPAFVPSRGSEAPPPPPAGPPPSQDPPAACSGAGLPAVGPVSGGMHWAPGGIPNDSCAAIQPAPYGGALSLWKAPPAPFDRAYLVDPGRYPAMWQFWPVCAWWAHEMRSDYSPAKINHRDPRVGATIRYAAGVLGAGSAGHVGHVVAVYTNGWILSAEMNFYWRGGGAGKVIYRFIPAHTSGVTYVY
jgi:hypothetical protein